MSPIFFSFLTGSLNHDATIKDTLDSLCTLTCHYLEHSVIGKSNDGTVELLKNFERAYSLAWI